MARFAVLLVLAVLLVGCAGEDPVSPAPLAEPSRIVSLDATEFVDLPGEPGSEFLERPQPEEIGKLEREIVHSAHLVAKAADAYAREHEGLYPSTVGDLVEYLPGGSLLEHPLYHLATNPVDGASAYQGEVGYVPVHEDGYVRGYVVSAILRYYRWEEYQIVVLPD